MAHILILMIRYPQCNHAYTWGIRLYSILLSLTFFIFDKALSIILVVSMLGAIGTMAFVIATPKVGERFTEFYILDYPTELRMGMSAVA